MSRENYQRVLTILSEISDPLGRFVISRYREGYPDKSFEDLVKIMARDGLTTPNFTLRSKAYKDETSLLEFVDVRGWLRLLRNQGERNDLFVEIVGHNGVELIKQLVNYGNAYGHPTKASEFDDSAVEHLAVTAERFFSLVALKDIANHLRQLRRSWEASSELVSPPLPPASLVPDTETTKPPASKDSSDKVAALSKQLASISDELQDQIQNYRPAQGLTRTPDDALNSVRHSYEQIVDALLKSVQAIVPDVTDLETSHRLLEERRTQLRIARASGTVQEMREEVNNLDIRIRALSKSGQLQPFAEALRKRSQEARRLGTSYSALRESLASEERTQDGLSKELIDLENATNELLQRLDRLSEVADSRAHCIEVAQELQRLNETLEQYGVGG